MADWIDNEQDFLEYWESESSGRKANFIEEFLRSYVTEVFIEESKFAKRLKKGPTVATLTPSWQTQRGYPNKVMAMVESDGGGGYQVTFSGKFNGQTLTVALLKQIVNLGQVLHKDVLGLPHQVKVTAAPTSTLTVACEAHGNTTIDVDTAATEYSLLNVPWADTRDFERPTALPRAIESTFTETFKGFVQMTQTDKNLKERLIKDPFNRQVRLVLDRMTQTKAANFIKGRPTYSVSLARYVSGYDVADPTLAGLLWWPAKAYLEDPNPNTYVNAGGAEPTLQMLQRLGHALRVQEQAKIKSSHWVVLAHPTTLLWKDSWNLPFLEVGATETTAGVQVKHAVIEGELIPFLDDQNMPEEVMVLVGMDDISWSHFKGGEFTRTERKPMGDYDQWDFREQIAGLTPEEKRWIGVIYNLRKFPLAA